MPHIKVIQAGDLIVYKEYQYDVPKQDSTKKKRGRVASTTEILETDEEREALEQKRRTSSINRCRESFHMLVRANLFNHPPYLLTLTMREIVSLAEAYRLYSAFVARLRRQVGNNPSWIAVPEFQKRGAVHFHILIWDLPPEFLKSERKTRRLAKLWGHGFADLAKRDSSPQNASYLSKYMTKAMMDSRLFGKRAYSASRNVKRPLTLTSPAPISIALEEWGITPLTKPLSDREYDSIWMGKCRDRRYSLNDLAKENDSDTIPL